MNTSNLIQTISIAALPILFAITLHEAAHGYVARHFGDPTAERAGRISLNPLRHIDPVGTILLPIMTLALSGFLFGWAKPVPVNFNKLRNPKKDMLWVALAGPASNLFMAFCWAIVFKLALASSGSYFAEPMKLMAGFGIQINLILIALNILPLPPLDGGRIAVSLLPYRQAAALSRIEPYGMFILIFMAVMSLGDGSTILSRILMPIVSALRQLINLIL